MITTRMLCFGKEDKKTKKRNVFKPNATIKSNFLYSVGYPSSSTVILTAGLLCRAHQFRENIFDEYYNGYGQVRPKF